MANEKGPEPLSESAPSIVSEAADFLSILKPVIVPGKEGEARELIASAVQIERRIERRYAGPLPPASEMAGHEKVLPGAADRILAMAEAEQRARHTAQDRLVATEEKLKLRGQPYALAALFLLCVLAGAFLFMGYASQGATLAVSLVALVTAMFLGPELLKLLVRRERDDASQDGPDA